MLASIVMSLLAAAESCGSPLGPNGKTSDIDASSRCFTLGRWANREVVAGE